MVMTAAAAVVVVVVVRSSLILVELSPALAALLTRSFCLGTRSLLLLVALYRLLSFSLA